MRMRIEIEELDDEKNAGIVLTFPIELDFDTIIEILKTGFAKELLYSHIDRQKEFFSISFTTTIEKSRKLSHNIDKMWINLENRLN